jgi:tRNA U38,U39,U40 pseudouridine synthase TruA
MIGAGLLVARGVVPPDTVAIALQLPYKLNFPLVPAEGLFLRYAGFAFSGNKVFSWLVLIEEGAL